MGIAPAQRRHIVLGQEWVLPVSPREKRVSAGFGSLASGYVTVMTIPYVGRCLGSGELPREDSTERVGDHLTGVCVACSGRFELRDDKVMEHETAPDDERESLHEDTPQTETPPSRTEDDAGPTPEEEMRGAQAPNAEPGGPAVEYETGVSGNTAEVPDLDEVTETGSGRSAQWSHDP